MKLRTDFVTNSSSVSFIVSVDKKRLAAFLDAIPEGDWGDGENEIYGVFVNPDELPEKDKGEIYEYDAARDLEELKAGFQDRKDLGTSWSPKAMAAARRALEGGDAVVCFSLAYLFSDLEPKQVKHILRLCTQIDAVT